jgi:hypothetical protein
LVFKAKDVSDSLCEKGFQEDSGRDHKYYFFYHDGKKSSIKTKISHGAREIDDYLCSAMSKQLNLTRAQFRDLVECPLEAEEYLRLMIDTGHLIVARPSGDNKGRKNSDKLK